MFVSERPDMMLFWDNDNNILDPAQLSLKSCETVNWKCRKCGYKWSTTVRGRANNSKRGLCPCCETNRYTKKGINDCVTLCPELALDYKSELNPGIDIYSHGSGSHQKVLWECHVCHYKWKAPIYSRIAKGKDGHAAQCPNCIENRHTVSLGEKYPKLKNLYSDNNSLQLSEITRSDTKKYKWRCEKHGEFDSTIASMIRSINNNNSGCPYCHGNKVKVEDSFAALHPELVNEWDPANDNTPYDVKASSSIKVGWICDKGHKWKATVYQRHSGYGFCPECYPFGRRGRFIDRYPEAYQYYSEENEKPITDFSLTDPTSVIWKCQSGHVFRDSFSNYNCRGYFKCKICSFTTIVPGTNDLLTLYPDIAEWYDKEKNSIPVNKVPPKSSNLAWWKCGMGHSYSRQIYIQVKSGLCPVCENRRVIPGVTDILSSYPRIEEIWDYKKNKKPPEQCLATSCQYYHFICHKGHQYKARLETVNENNYECLICNNYLLNSSTNSLLAVYPELAKEWSPNNPMGPESVWFSKDTPHLWICPVCHGEYREAISKRRVGDNSCPYCNNQVLLPGQNDIATVYPHLVNEWSKRNKKDPSLVGAFYKSRFRWTCPNCNHDYLATIEEKKTGIRTCEVCRNRRTVTGYNDLASNAPQLLEEWSEKNTSKPEETNFFMSTPVWWSCKKCNHDYRFPIQEKLTLADKSCPYCNGKRVLSGVNDLATTDPILAEEWSPNNSLSVHNARREYKGKFIWQCKKCHRNFRSTIQQRITGEGKCPYCYNRKIITGVNDLKSQYPELIPAWSSNNQQTPENVLATTMVDLLWICPYCHGEYWATIEEQRTKDDVCPYCAGRKVLPGFNDLKTKLPELIQFWSPNNQRSPENVLATTMVDLLWICPYCHGEYCATIEEQRTKDDVCPYCAGRKILPGFNDLKTKFPELMPEWFETANMLIGLTPEHVYEKTTENAWWQCLDCGYKYPLSIKIKCEKHHRNMKTCLYCAGRRAFRHHFV